MQLIIVVIALVVIVAMWVPWSRLWALVTSLRWPSSGGTNQEFQELSRKLSGIEQAIRELGGKL